MPARVTERTFYEPLLRVIADKGGTGVQEVSYNSDPDIEFRFIGRRWLLSVKIGESPAQIKAAFLQYLRHKHESGIAYGLLLVLPESVRRTRAEQSAVLQAILDSNVSVLLDAGTVKDEYRDQPFPAVLDRIRNEVWPLLRTRQTRYYPLRTVVNLLREQVTEVMDLITLNEPQFGLAFALKP